MEPTYAQPGELTTTIQMAHHILQSEIRKQ